MKLSRGNGKKKNNAKTSGKLNVHLPCKVHHTREGHSRQAASQFLYRAVPSARKHLTGAKCEKTSTLNTENTDGKRRTRENTEAKAGKHGAKGR